MWNLSAWREDFVNREMEEDNSDSDDLSVMQRQLFNTCRDTLKEYSDTLGNRMKELESSIYDKAGFFLSAAENQAMSIDNYDLLTDASLARCSLSLSVNPPDIETAERYVGFAQGFVKNCVDPKKQQALVALNEVRIETAKGNLDENANVNISALLNKLEENKKDVKGDPYYEAQFTLAQGDAYKLKKDYVQADKSYTAAAKIRSVIALSWRKNT